MTDAWEKDLALYVAAAAERKAEDVIVLDVRGMTSVADAFIICSGRSNRQVSALAEHVQRRLKDNGVRPLSVDGIKDGHWVLMDYGHVVIHLFYDPMRRFYDLEGLWADAPRLDVSTLTAVSSPKDAINGEPSA